RQGRTNSPPSARLVTWREGTQELVMTLPTTSEADGPSLFEHISTHWSVVTDPFRFVLRYSRAVRGYVTALIRNEHDAEAVAQSFLVQAVGKPFAPEQVRRGRFRDYLKAMLRNAAVTHFRRSAQRSSVALEGAFPDPGVEDAADREWLAEWRGCLLQR